MRTTITLTAMLLATTTNAAAILTEKPTGGGSWMELTLHGPALTETNQNGEYRIKTAQLNSVGGIMHETFATAPIVEGVAKFWLERPHENRIVLLPEPWYNPLHDRDRGLYLPYISIDVLQKDWLDVELAQPWVRSNNTQIFPVIFNGPTLDGPKDDFWAKGWDATNWPKLPGNGDGLLAWQRGYGRNYDHNMLDFWEYDFNRARYSGNPYGVGAVPEPAAIVLAIAGLVILATRFRRA